MGFLGIAKRIGVPRGGKASALACCGACALVLLSGLDAPAQTGSFREYQVKAVFLYNFAQFVEWPTTVFADARSPIVIGVLGENPFGTYLTETVLAELVDNRPLEIQRFHSVAEIETCHILFVSRSETNHLEQIFTALKDRRILTVGDVDDFVQRGGMVRLATAQNRVRLTVNIEAAKAANLTISSKILRSADVATTSTK